MMVRRPIADTFASSRRNATRATVTSSSDATPLELVDDPEVLLAAALDETSCTSARDLGVGRDIGGRELAVELFHRPWDDDRGGDSQPAPPRKHVTPALVKLRAPTSDHDCALLRADGAPRDIPRDPTEILGWAWPRRTRLAASRAG
jgi:hypothetical protein